MYRKCAWYWSPGEVRAVHFPLPSRGGGTESWQRGKPGLVEIGFPFLVGLQPPSALLPLYFLPSALLHGCAQAGGTDLAPC